ncbi:3-hydroxyacyl-ACP dehydratase FabZ [Geomonas paludis]|uniref:3-hydroxyacyl-[acyl-carrier-protein] dehydratase FabZ n=1 Tax=Geomonas paludis TaxID=2740185 RepID=A0A6V8N2E3_9BACT|nr:3-hydroxyacyl-ACP dehydratase FabZ [Geomonas paludis]UPU36860.1 3-hydroxyacyl-ACP dehydratase FabZ [Geomonas paludis]GFO65529.1 3-hydroxyacyl-[acyl-carrier-protein] dehydratase FabZ [Geomonas paludis]
MLDIVQIMEILPHRYPFLLIDKVLELEPGKRVVAMKNVTMNEPFFQGHFPGFPVMPGVLIIEAMAQSAAILAYTAMADAKDKVSYFMAIDNARFRKPVKPGDTLRIEVETLFSKRGIWSCAAKAYVGDTLMTEAELKATLGDK